MVKLRESLTDISHLGEATGVLRYFLLPIFEQIVVRLSHLHYGIQALFLRTLRHGIDAAFDAFSDFRFHRADLCEKVLVHMEFVHDNGCTGQAFLYITTVSAGHVHCDYLNICVVIDHVFYRMQDSVAFVVLAHFQQAAAFTVHKDRTHKYFYDKSISDGYTLRIKREEIDTTVRADIHRNLQFEKSQIDAKKDTMRTDGAYISSLGKFIETDFLNFRLVNADSTIGGMIVCSSNPQARKVKEWFDENVSTLETGLVISDEDAPRSDINKETQRAFRKTLKPDILIVHQMLTTGYDVPRLKKMYLLRNAKEHTLLQTISRVNRPYKNPKTGKVYQYGYIVDFVDIEKEYDRTIEMYLKEMEDDFNDDSDEHFSLAGLVIGPEDIDKKYHAYQAHMNTLVDTSVNLELFSQQLVKLDRDTLLAIRRDLNGIKDCRTEFLLSRAMTLAAQIDEDRIKKLLREVQNRIDFLNLTTKPIDLMTVVSNEEVVKIVYEFFKVKISIMDMSKLTKAFKDVSDIDGYKQFTDAVTDIQKEIRRNKNTGAEKIVSLEDLLKKIFVELEYIDLNNLSEVNGKLLKILEDLRCINEENERLAARYGGNYAFVKTYSDVVEMHPEFDKEDLAKLTDVAYAAVKDIEGSNILILHGRESFVNTVKKNTTTQLLKSGLYKKLNLKDWYADFLGETYSNMRIF